MKARSTKAATRLGLIRARANDKGAVAVETSVAALLLCILLFGIVEMGLLISQNLAISTSTRSGARVGATLGNAVSADYHILQAVKNSRGFMSLDDIDYVVVYRADAAAGDVPEQCAKGQAVPGTCNVYTRADLESSEAVLAGSGQSNAWHPSSREQLVDHVGVWMEVKHHWLTGLFASEDGAVADTTVMQIQPAVYQPWVPEIPAATAPIVATTTTAKPSTTTTTRKPTTTTAKPSTTTTKAPLYPTTTTTTRPTTTTAKPTTTTKKPTTTTAKPTTTTAKPRPTIPNY